MELELNELNRLLIGDRSQRSRNEGSPPAISERVDGIVEDLWSSTSAPTQTHRDALDVAARQFEPVLGRLRALKEKESTEILPALEKAGAPWTPGRVPDWRRK
jgi:hypothetical protein